VLAALAALGLSALAVAVSAVDPLPGEDWLLRALVVADRSAQHDLWAGVARATDLVPLVVVSGASAVVLLVRRRWLAALDLLLVSGVVWAVNPLLKSAVARPRPDVVDLPSGLSGYSFPAGHAANTAVLALGLLLVAGGSSRRSRWPAVAGAAFVLLAAYGQLALGRHYPSDLVAGWLLSVAVVAGTVAAGWSRRTAHGGPEPSSQIAP
jgi:undecaprenyl-diphosphatase